MSTATLTRDADTKTALHHAATAILGEHWLPLTITTDSTSTELLYTPENNPNESEHTGGVAPTTYAILTHNQNPTKAPYTLHLGEFLDERTEINTHLIEATSAQHLINLAPYILPQWKPTDLTQPETFNDEAISPQTFILIALNTGELHIHTGHLFTTLPLVLPENPDRVPYLPGTIAELRAYIARELNITEADVYARPLEATPIHHP